MKKYANVRIPSLLYKRVKQLALDNDKSITLMLSEIIAFYVQKSR